ncbi:methyltransferase [Aureimonas ureilytica]|uniref:Methyltransferase n=3 Tax=Pseudomonadota TaxID=1224 RepID=A0A175R5X5_9HYPH|nr:methyltransferase [Aureimonas ureilytica]KTW16573.1 methyltransferase [Sphingomonas sanguinis]
MIFSNCSPDSIVAHNQAAWDKLAAQDCEWSRPVSSQAIAAARRGDWSVRLIPDDMPDHWLGQVAGRDVLCLASAGGQQAPILAAAGATVTVLDASEGQLEQDRLVAAREGLALSTIRGDMRDLSVFPDESFDIIFHPISNLYVPDIRPVWKECYRTLRKGGRLLASFYNPVVFVGDRDPQWREQGLIRPIYALPYADTEDMETNELEAKVERGEALVYGHSLTDQIGGQTEAGFRIAGFAEARAPAPRFVIDQYLPTFLATLALKPL